MVLTIYMFFIMEEINDMSKITMLSEKFEVEQTGEQVEAVTIIIDNKLKEFLDIMKLKKPEYDDNLSIIKDALIRGLDSIRSEI